MINRIHGGNIWQYLKAPKNRLIDFSANINPLGISPGVKKIIAGNINMLAYYPEPQAQSLKAGIADYHNINKNNILIGNGSIELIHLIPRALKPGNTLIIGPTFSEYEFAVRLNKSKPVFVLGKEQKNFRINTAGIKKAIPKTGLIFLCNPNNPTSAVMQKNELMEIIWLCKRHNSVLAVDEAFMDFVRNSKEITLLNESVRHNRVLVIRSLTKFFSLPGLRIGYLTGQQSIIRHISKFQYPWNVNLPAQLAAREALKDRQYIKSSKRIIREEADFLFENLCRINGLKVYPPSANFVFCKLEKCRIKSARQLNNALLKYGIVIRCCNNFRGLDNRFFRVAVRTRSENKQLIKSLKAGLK